MKDSPLTAVLIGLLALMTLCSAGLSYLYIRSAAELRNLNTQVGFVNNNHALVNAVATDAVEYGKKNPAINPLLEAIGIKLKAGLTNKPAIK